MLAHSALLIKPYAKPEIRELKNLYKNAHEVRVDVGSIYVYSKRNLKPKKTCLVWLHVRQELGIGPGVVAECVRIWQAEAKATANVPPTRRT